jgi:hypothetical protein
MASRRGSCAVTSDIYPAESQRMPTPAAALACEVPLRVPLLMVAWTQGGTNARTKGLNRMGIGTGIVLAVLGLILLTGTIQVDLPGIEDYTLGWILVIAGVIAVLLSMTVWRRGGTTRVVERDVQPPM